MKQAKISILLICILLPALASAMKIEKDEIDEFTGKRTLITSWESLCGQKIHVRFRLQNGFDFLDFKMFVDDAIVIGEKDKILFKSTTDNIGTFSSISIYRGDIGGGAVGLNGSGAWGIYAHYQGDLSFFADNVTRLIRVYTTDVYYDKKVSENDGKKLRKLYALFSSALTGKSGETTSYFNYTITYLKSTNGGKSWDVVNEDYIKDATQAELNEKVNAWKSKSAGKNMFECRIKKEK